MDLHFSFALWNGILEIEVLSDRISDTSLFSRVLNEWTHFHLRGVLKGHLYHRLRMVILLVEG